MAVTIKINGTDRTSLIDWRTFVFSQALTHQIDTVDFVIKRFGSKIFKPDLLDDIEIFEDAEKVFGGKIVESSEVIEGRLEQIKITCKDHAHEMDSVLVQRVFEDTTIDAIIEEIKNDFLPAGFTTTGVNVTNLVDFVAFNFEQPSKVFQQLAELTGADWFVDPDKDIKFFTKNTLTAPFELNDDDGNYIFNSLVINRDVKNLRNVIFVRGGTFSGSDFEEEQEADGDTKVFTQGFKYKTVRIKVNGVSKTIGIDNITDPTTVDVLYNFQEKAIKFPSPLLTGDIVLVGGLPQIPVIIKLKDNVSVSEFGIFEHKIIDKSIDSKEGARERAKAEIIAWANKINEGGFRTRKSGLRVGQQIKVKSTIRGLDEIFHISRIRTKLESPTDLIHEVTLMTQRTFGMVEFLQDLLIKKDKEIEINPDEVLDKIEAALETITLTEAAPVVLTAHNPQTESAVMGEAVAVQALNFPTVFVLAPFPVPTGFKRELALDGGVLS